jgi:hypothetical protein
VELFGDAVILVGDIGVDADVDRQDDDRHAKPDPESKVTLHRDGQSHQEGDRADRQVDHVPLATPQVEAQRVFVEDPGDQRQPRHERGEQDDGLPE